MKKLLISLVAVAFIMPSVTLASIDANLKYGSRGMEVTELQEFLIDKGFLTGQTSGNFFALTRKAVIAWQASVGLPATGFVGSMSRAKINEDLSTANASAVSAEVAETGTTTLTQTQTTSSSASFASGCTSTTGFSTTTGKPCSAGVVASNTTANRIITFPNGSVAEIDSRGDVVRWIKEAIVAAQSSSQSTEIQISSINITPTINSVRIEWQTNTPTNSKVFLSGWVVEGAKADARRVQLQKVYNSESGLSTRHMISVSGLSSDANYSYEIESIGGNQQVAKKVGSFTTNAPKPDEYTISVQPDKISVPASGWHGISIKVSTLKNGQSQSNQNVSMTTPDSSQNRSSTNGNNTFTYYPKTAGVHKLEFSWNGVTKSVDVQATPYQRVEQSIINVFDNNAVVPLGTTNQTIGSFTISASDELTRIVKAGMNSTGQKNLIRFLDGATFVGEGSGNSVFLEGWRMSDTLEIKLKLNEAVEVGIYTVTINSIEMIGQNSGMSHQVLGLPIVFHYEVR